MRSTADPERRLDLLAGEVTCLLGRLDRTDAASPGFDLAGGGRCPLGCYRASLVVSSWFGLGVLRSARLPSAEKTRTLLNDISFIAI